MSDFTPTARTKVRQKPQRGVYDRAVIESILDEAFVCQIGFVLDGQPYVIPTNYVRVGDRLFLHGSTASRMFRALAGGAALCLSVTLIDGLVLAPSATGHSINYRSVVVLGKAEAIEDAQEKFEAMRAFVERVIPGRWESVRPPSEQELKGTMVLALPLTEVSAKVRTGPPLFLDEDAGWEPWTGVLPLKLAPGEAVPALHGKATIPLPDYLRNYRRRDREAVTKR
ncbi:MAG: pyridoxamine 5'-phosphate oxidase family protein [Acidobacteriia bacterium]|nr:pyridoxamine 5'-phosphate oxidase family protein [Terriglobia bacterium]